VDFSLEKDLVGAEAQPNTNNSPAVFTLRVS
jgi:hypothetical protein